MATNLTTATNTGAQDATSSPQTASTTSGASVSGGTPATIQPGTTSSLLTSGGGIPLSSPNLSTVSVAAAGTQASTSASIPTTHKFNPALLGISGGLLVIAIVLFYVMNSAEKNTTKR